jgi:IstB-like ATP binding protein
LGPVRAQDRCWRICSSDVFKRLKAARLDNTLEAEMRRLAGVELLIIDDLALQAMDATETADFYQLCVERCPAAPDSCDHTPSSYQRPVRVHRHGQPRRRRQYAGVLRPSAEVSDTCLKAGARRYAAQDPCFSAERVLIIVLPQAGPLA